MHEIFIYLQRNYNASEETNFSCLVGISNGKWDWLNRFWYIHRSCVKCGTDLQWRCEEGDFAGWTPLLTSTSLWWTKRHGAGFSPSSSGVPVNISLHCRTPYSYIIWGMNNLPVRGSSSETLYHLMKTAAHHYFCVIAHSVHVWAVCKPVALIYKYVCIWSTGHSNVGVISYNDI
jgi:hypothetical protein